MIWQWNIPKIGVSVSDWCYQSKRLPNGGVQWLLWEPWTSSIGRCTRYSTVAPLLPSKWSAKWTHCASSFCLLLPWQPRGQCGASSCPMAASSGFLYSPGHAALGDVVCIAPLQCHGYQNGQQRRYICLLPPPHLFDQNVAKRPCYDPFKLAPSYYINLIGVISISLFVSYCPSPPTMDAICATIVAGRWAWFWQHTEASLN